VNRTLRHLIELSTMQNMLVLSDKSRLGQKSLLGPRLFPDRADERQSDAANLQIDSVNPDKTCRA